MLIIRLVGLICACVTIYWLMLKILDHSPSLSQINLNLIILIWMVLIPCVSITFTLMYKMNGRLVRIDERTKQTNNILFALAKDFKNHKHDNKGNVIIKQ